MKPLEYLGNARIIESEQIRPFDVDDTLVRALEPNHIPGISSPRIVEVYDRVENKHIKMYANEPNIRLLLEEHHRGGFIIVWSRSGYEWAANVVKALGLEDKVDLVMSKPMVYFDDKPVSEWLTDRVFLDHNVRYKR